MWKGRNLFFIIGLVIISVVVFIIALQAEAPGYTSAVVTFNTNVDFSVAIADNNNKRQQGLSGVQSLKYNEGMLFVFDTVDYHQFWMKDMLFPLDFVWIDQNWNVADITENVLPGTYPQIFTPKVPVQYVLEIPAGSVEKFGITIDTKVSIQ